MTAARTLELLFYCCVNLLPELLLILVACRDFLRFSMQTTTALSMGVLACYCSCTIAYDAGALSYLAANVILNVTYILFGVFLTKDKPWQLLFALGMILNYGSVCSITAAGLYHVLNLPGTEFGWYSSLITLAVAAVLWPLYHWMLARKMRPLFTREGAEESWRILWIVPAFFCVIHYFCIWTEGGNYASRPLNVLFLMFLNLGAAFISCLVAYTADVRAERLRLEAENQRFAIEAAQYENLKERMEQTRRARHDLRQHLRLIQSYLDTGNEAALRDYIHAYGQSLPADTKERYSQNIVADSVVRYYAEQAEAKGIAFSAQLEFPSALSLPEPDLCVVLGDLLENALESCERHIEDSPSVRLAGKLIGTQMLTIVVDNSPADEPKWEKAALISSKRHDIGTGTASLRAIAKRYGGEADFRWKDGVFSASIVLLLRQKDGCISG
ncbi:MAG: GHKL domain-containing protein [Faecalibacterium sp.]|nr:GHKL domain-containing protein [Faecalibacterium sp.]